MTSLGLVLFAVATLALPVSITLILVTSQRIRENWMAFEWGHAGGLVVTVLVTALPVVMMLDDVYTKVLFGKAILGGWLVIGLACIISVLISRIFDLSFSWRRQSS